MIEVKEDSIYPGKNEGRGKSFVWISCPNCGTLIKCYRQSMKKGKRCDACKEVLKIKGV